MTVVHDITTKICDECGREISILHPDQWAYKQRKGARYIYWCSWSCLREAERKNNMDKEYTKVRKDGTPAKKPGPKPKNNNPVVIETPDGQKEITKESISKMTPEEVSQANVAMMAELVKKTVTKAVNYDGFTVAAVEGEFGRYFHDKTSMGDYIDYESKDGDELSMTVDQWKAFLKELYHAAAVLGVEL